VSCQLKYDDSPESPPPKRQRYTRNKLDAKDNKVLNLWEGMQVKVEPTEGEQQLNGTVLLENEAHGVELNGDGKDHFCDNANDITPSG
jgi:hypothetical protein